MKTARSTRITAMIREVAKSGPGLAGLIMLGLLLVISLVVVVAYPPDFGSARWGNPSVWADNPKSAAPAWTNLLTPTDRARHLVRTLDAPTMRTSTERANQLDFDFGFELAADEAPTRLSLSVEDVTFEARPPVLTATLVRPDGVEILLLREVVRGPRRGEEAPYVRHDEEPLRVVLGTDRQTADQLLSLFEQEHDERVSGADIADAPLAALFGLPDDGRARDSDDSTGALFAPLRGEYTLRLRVLTAGDDDTVGSVKAVFGGSVYGAMGTDALGRDLAEGLLFGLPVALLIGILTATVSTLLGMTLGMASGYFGGATDMILQRAADIVANVPLLPLLIFLVFIVGSHLWLILGILVAFSWPGLTIMVRSMVLQLRNGQEVEAAKALGASSWRIIFRHILPHAASYLLAQLVFFAPSAILAEAGLSFLGLGDPSIPTWGQILEYGFRTGAVFLGYWWWVIPPGLLIVITAVTFMFLALGLEPVVDPRLRGRRLWRS